MLSGCQAEKSSMSKAAADMSRRSASRVKAVQARADSLQAELLQIREELHNTIPLKVSELVYAYTKPVFSSLSHA
jgi:hypothetical protein